MKRKSLVAFFTATVMLSMLITGCGFERKTEEAIYSEVATVVNSSATEENLPAEESIVEPTEVPTQVPAEAPTPEPTEESTVEPTEEPTPEPTEAPTPEPTEEPTLEPTEEPTPVPTQVPTPAPTEEPTPEPTEVPTPTPTEAPTHVHSWSNATCTSPKTCQCGETSGAKLEHDFGSNNETCSRCGVSNPNYIAPHTHSYSSVINYATCANDGEIIYTCSCGDTYTEKIPATGSHAYGYGEINCMFCGTPHEHDWKIVVQTNSGVEIIPDEDFVCHSGWYFDTFEELRAHMDIPNVHGMVYLNDGSNGVTSVPRDYEGEVDFYACCHGWANCSGDGEGERIEYEITQEVQFCNLCGVRGEAFDVGERVITLHTYDD